MHFNQKKYLLFIIIICMKIHIVCFSSYIIFISGIINITIDNKEILYERKK